MAKKIGPHLLGCSPSPPDERDWKLSTFMGDRETLLGRAVEELKKTTVGYSYFTRKDAEPGKKSAWGKALAALALVDKTWAQPNSDVVWNLPKVLDQGNTPHCVGFGWAGWSIAPPYENSKYADKDAHEIYYEIKEIEGEPKQENGAYVRSGAQAMKDRKRLRAYAFADDPGVMRTYLHSKGPIVVGTSWTGDMFTPDANGFVKPTGENEGGHCYLLIGDLVSESSFVFQNSWGSSWGMEGRFKMKYSDFFALWSDWGEAVGALELDI